MNLSESDSCTCDMVTPGWPHQPSCPLAGQIYRPDDRPLTTGVLYADAGGASTGTIHVGVADVTGTLIDYDVCHDSMLNLAEMYAVRLACQHIGHDTGVILTDSLTAAKSMGRPWGLHKLTTRVDEMLAMRDAIKRDLPDGWRVAWIPREGNLADAALAERIAAEMNAPL